MEEERRTITEERERVESVLREEERKAAPFVAGGSIVEMVSGATAVVVSILGLLNVFGIQMASVAVLAIGAGLLIGGGAMTASFTRLLMTPEGQAAIQPVRSVASGMALETLIGAGGIALGVLALLNTAPLVLVPIAVIAYGAVFLMASGANARITDMLMRRGGASERMRLIAREAANAASGVEMLVGLGAIVTGILAIAGFAPLILSLSATLALGAAFLMSRTAIASRLLKLFCR